MPVLTPTCPYRCYLLLIGKRTGFQETDQKMITYKGYTIEKFAPRGLYQVSDSNGNAIAMFILVRDCKRFINAKAGA